MNRTHAFNRKLSAIALTSLIVGCGGGGSNPGPRSTPTPVPTPTPTPTATAVASANAYTCASSDTVAAAARESASGEASTRRSAVRKSSPTAVAQTGLIAVEYAGTTLGAAARAFAVARESAVGASLVREMRFSHVNKYQRILHVTPGTEASALARLRQQPGVVAASVTGLARSGQTVAQKYFTNDPYYQGFTQAQLTASADTGAVPTYHVDPYEQSASVPGQWGMHATRLDYAQEYSQSGNGSGITNAGALGSANVKIAIIDSGEDSTHPELASKITRQRCFLTNPSGRQSTGDFSVDQDGHGTDVSGIAAAAQNNTLGFTGSGGLASIFAYQIFPTPNDTCVIGGSNAQAQCDATSSDIASAINDAVSAGANVINLSLGGGSCSSNGTDPDINEGASISNALNANVVIVAASGNGGSSGVSAPGCDNGVIAVGATSLSDGVANGTPSSPVGSASAPIEYVAGYSQYGSPAAAANNSSAWGIVAPGGDPSAADADPNATTTDDLHWIENIWTTTPLDANFDGNCKSDLGNPAGPPDCRTLIAGTSQATPLVAGAVALIIAANSTYQSPSKMKQLLCTTAHDIGDAHEGCGRIDIYRAMATAVGDPVLPASQ